MHTIYVILQCSVLLHGWFSDVINTDWRQRKVDNRSSEGSASTSPLLPFHAFVPVFSSLA